MGDRRWSETPRWEAPVLAAVACVAVSLRFVRLDLGWFGVDQARDVATALDIVTGRAWPLIGPTMRRVTRLGALYHYFWALPYLVWRDPIAGYWFAACLSTTALVVSWYVARRLWGPLAGVTTAAVAAVHPVWVIDGRICWAPAALPCVAALLILTMLGEPSRGRIALVGALLGLAVQLHLTMVGWAAGIGLVLILDRVPPRTLLPGLVAGAVVAAPAAWAIFTAPAATESGIGTLATRAPYAALGPRVLGTAMLPARIVAGFGRFGDTVPLADALHAAALALAIVIAGGLVRLLADGVRGDRSARVVLVPAAVTVLLVLGLPGDAWYYYLDSALPLWALAAGALVGTRSASTWDDVRLRWPIAAGVLAACVLLAVVLAGWVWRVRDLGYVPVDPAYLTLDGKPGRDAPSRGRVTTLEVKRRAAVLAAPLAHDFDALWHRVHGPAFPDASGDNGFWMRWALDEAATPAGDGTGSDRRHLAFWYGDDPTAVALAAAAPEEGVDLTHVGPLLAVRYPSMLDYDACVGDAVATRVPIRVVPDPRRYGDGTTALPSTLPSRVSCPLRAGPPDAAAAEVRRAGRQVVATLGGEGTVAVEADGQRSAPPARIAAICVARGAAAVGVAIVRSPDAPAELALSDVPLGVGCGSSPAAPPTTER